MCKTIDSPRCQVRGARLAKRHRQVRPAREHLLAPILGIGDPRTDKRIDFVGGVLDLEQRVRQRRAAIAFSLHPTRMEQLMAVADAGKLMPPKSTWFEPKLADGLLSHVLD
jgi:uncharacterized protein (DUF1015 family)